jgi:hypothetical protein
MDWNRLLWAGILLNGSGIISLTLALDSRVKVALLIGGFVLEGAFGILIFLAHRKINALITKLEQTQ